MIFFCLFDFFSGERWKNMKVDEEKKKKSTCLVMFWLFSQSNQANNLILLVFSRWGPIEQANPAATKIRS